MGKDMTGTERERERCRRRRAWKTAGTVLLGLMSGSLGCQGTGAPLRHAIAPPVASEGCPHPQTIPSSGQPAAQASKPIDESGLRTASAVEPLGATGNVLQIGATNIVPLGATPPPTSTPLIVRASSSRGDPDGADAEERNSVGHEATAPSSQATPNAAAPNAEKKSETIERKWTAAQVADKGGRDQDKGYQVDRTLPNPTAGMATPAIPTPEKVRPLSLAAALAQAGAENPVIAIARQAVQSALGLQLQARALMLPNVNIGTNYYLTNGPIQASFGAIRKVDRDAVYYGFGAGAYVAGTVNIPGLFINTALADAIFEPQVARNVVANRGFLATAARNDVMLEVSTAYLTLMSAEGRLAILRQSEADFDEIVRLTAAFAKRGRGRQGDADRAEAAALAVRYDEQEAQRDVAVTSADLAHLLNLDPSTRLLTGDIPLQVVQFVDPQVTLPKLLEIAVRNRPEMMAAAANIRANQARVRRERNRPFLPILVTGLSAGDFGGGSVASTPGFNSFAQQGIGPQEGQLSTGGGSSSTRPNIGYTIPKFGKISGRIDVDVMALWQLQNMGFGNIAHVRETRALVGRAEAERLRVLNEVQRQVSEAFNRSAEHFRSIDIERRRVQEATQGLQLDMERIRFGEGLPIEVLDNARRLREARIRLLDAVIGFDRAQFELFVALGQPPTLVVDDDKPVPPPSLPAPPAEPAPPAPLPRPEQLPPPNLLPPEKK
jgi:outer membrane protein TolC